MALAVPAQMTLAHQHLSHTASINNSVLKYVHIQEKYFVTLNT